MTDSIVLKAVETSKDGLIPDHAALPMPRSIVTDKGSLDKGSLTDITYALESMVSAATF